MNVDQGFQLSDLRGILRRRAAVIGLVSGSVFLASVLVAFWLPNRFEARTTLLVEPQVINKKLFEAGVEKSDLNQRLHLMTMQILSRPRLSKIIDDLKLYPDESEEMTREEVIEYMRKHIRVEPVLPELETQQQLALRRQNVDYEINTFQLFFASESAKMAADVTNRLANDFIEEHIKERVQISGDTSEFIESELQRLMTRIQQVDAQVAQVKGQNPGRLPEDLDANQRLLERSIDDLRVVQRELAEAQSDEAFYKQQALVSASTALAPNDQTSPAARLESLRQQLSAYRSRGYTDKHPDVAATQLEMTELEQRIQQQGSDDKSSALSLPQQNAEAERRRAALRVASAQGALKTVQAQVDDIQARLGDTPRVQEQLLALEREYKHLSDNQLQFSNKRLEAGVQANMERRQKGEQFRVLDTAVPPPRPSSPNRILIVLVGAMLGLAMGAGLGILLESADSSFHVARDLQAALRVPVLAAIPEILLDADRAAARRLRLRHAIAAVSVSGVVMLGAMGGYLYNNGLPNFFDSTPDRPAAATAAARPAPTLPAAETEEPAPPPAAEEAN